MAREGQIFKCNPSVAECDIGLIRSVLSQVSESRPGAPGTRGKREHLMNISLREASDKDIVFARSVYFETMRWIIERLFGWDQARDEEKFAQFFKLDEARIIVANGQDAGWIAEQVDTASVNIGSFYVIPPMQSRGIGTRVLQMLIEEARSQSKAITLAVVKFNPAFRFYEKHGFRITSEDEYKFYLSAK
jgi:GNAT superfamily N-acetyltransferase